MKLLLTGRAPCAASREKIFPARFMKQISLQSIKKSLIIWRGCLFTTAKKDNNIIVGPNATTPYTPDGANVADENEYNINISKNFSIK